MFEKNYTAGKKYEKSSQSTRNPFKNERNSQNARMMNVAQYFTLLSTLPTNNFHKFTRVQFQKQSILMFGLTLVRIVAASKVTENIKGATEKQRIELTLGIREVFSYNVQIENAGRTVSFILFLARFCG